MDLPFLTPGIPGILMLALLALAVSVAAGLLAARRSAGRLIASDTGLLLKENE